MPHNLLDIIRAIEARICAHIAMALFTVRGHDDEIEVVLEQSAGGIRPCDADFEGGIAVRRLKSVFPLSCKR